MSVNTEQDGEVPVRVFWPDDSNLEEAREHIDQVFQRVETVSPEAQNVDIDISPLDNFCGLDPSIYDQIEALLESKRHIIFYGPPGTGKTTLAEHVAREISPDGEGPLVVTAFSDWSSQDVIGGYQPVGEDRIAFRPGILLENFDRPVVIDEFNRADIDKAFGPLFTTLSGHSVTLPYTTDLADEEAERVQILASSEGATSAHQYAPTAGWRILATINTADKASLYQMSYALSRRFGWVRVGIPSDLQGFCQHHLGVSSSDAGEICPISDVWDAVNDKRPMGAAPFMDVMDYCRERNPDFDFFALPSGDSMTVLVEAIGAFVFPLLDGILKDDADDLAEAISVHLKGDESADILDDVRGLLEEMVV